MFSKFVSKFKCKNCGSKNTSKVTLQITRRVKNYCTGKEMLSNDSFKKGVYVCGDCCCVSFLEGSPYGSSWENAHKDLKKYMDNLAKYGGYKVEVYKVGG